MLCHGFTAVIQRTENKAAKYIKRAVYASAAASAESSTLMPSEIALPKSLSAVKVRKPNPAMPAALYVILDHGMMVNTETRTPAMIAASGVTGVTRSCANMKSPPETMKTTDVSSSPQRLHHRSSHGTVLVPSSFTLPPSFSVSQHPHLNHRYRCRCQRSTHW